MWRPTTCWRAPRSERRRARANTTTLKSLPVCFVQLAYVGLHAGVTVGVRQQALDGDEDLGEGEARHPVPLLDTVDADVPVPVHVGVEDLGEEANLRRPEWVEHRNLSTKQLNNFTNGNFTVTDPNGVITSPGYPKDYLTYYIKLITITSNLILFFEIHLQFL